jgi:arylformamidase
MNWRSFDAVALEYAYNPQKSVEDHTVFQTHRNAKAVKCRSEMPSHLDVPYGEGELNKADIFPAGEGSPVHLFFHGGYWRTQDKANFAFLAGTFVPRGVTTVIVNYDLCPKVTLDEVVESARASLEWTYRSIADFGGDPDRITVSGNSAGAHLCSMLLATDWEERGLPRDPIKGAVMFSGIFDPEPARWIPVNEEIGLTAEVAARNNSLALDPTVDCPVWIGAGGAEPWLWLEQTYEYSQHLRRHGLDPEVHILPGHNHFTVMDEMLEPERPIAKAVLDRAGL